MLARRPKRKRRLSIRQIEQITGLNFCDEDCGCGENSHLFFTDVTGGTPEEWLCANGWDREDVEEEIERRIIKKP